MADTFTRMDESTLEQWMVIGKETSANQGRVADRILARGQAVHGGYQSRRGRDQPDQVLPGGGGVKIP